MTEALRELSGAWNFRDVADGTPALRAGRLFRSGELSRLDDDGRATLSGLGITDVADLRANQEVARRGPGLVPDGIEIEMLEKKYGVTVTVGHSARLLGSIRRIRQAIDAGELGRVAFIEANFSNERALELTPNTWRWYKAKAPGGPLSQLAIHQFDILHYLGGDIAEASSMASKLSPVGAEVDDQSMTTLRFTDGKLGYVGSCWTSPGNRIGMCRSTRVASLELGSVDDLAAGSSPTTATTPPWRAVPANTAWRMASPARSSPGALPYQTPTTPS